jgi:hypothetical protein
MARGGPQSSSGSASITNPAAKTGPYPAQPAAADSTEPAAQSSGQRPLADLPQEHGGRSGPEPTRFGDWEKNGRCIDF